MSRGYAPSVTVVIPTLNGERYLGEVLDAIAAQRHDGDVETLVIDSGSSDATLRIIAERAQVRLHRIPNIQFGHGRTRNLGARLASGEVVAFLTQDATPAHESWLAELVAPLDPHGTDAVAVVGRQLPRPHAFPLLKYDIRRSFAMLGPADAVSVAEIGDRTPSEAELDALAFYSDVNSATRRSFLLDVIPYRDVDYSEDFAFARDLLLAGYRKAYAPRAAVVHSNDATVRGYRRRMIEETEGMGRAGIAVAPLSSAAAIAHAAVGALRDERRIVRDPDYGLAQTLRWLALNPAYHVARWMGIARASRSLIDTGGTAPPR